MRSLTSAAQTEKNKTSVKIANIIKVEWDAGTEYYSGSDLGSGDGSSALNAEGRVLSWNMISYPSQEGNTSISVGDIQVSLRDEDRYILDLVRSEGAAEKDVTIYQHFDGNGEGDLVTLFKGTIGEGFSWSNGESQFDCLNFARKYNSEDIFTRLTRDDFPYLNPSAEGKIVPWVYGLSKKSTGYCIDGGLRTKLMRPLGETQRTFYVEDAVDQGFPQNEEITIMVGTEKMRGTFSGNRFDIAERRLSIFSGSTTGDADGNALVCSDLSSTDMDGDYLWQKLRIKAPDDTWYERQVLMYIANQNKIIYGPPIWYEDGTAAHGFRLLEATSGTEFEIISNSILVWSIGTPVNIFRDTERWKYVVGDGECEKVDGVYYEGTAKVWDQTGDSTATGHSVSGQMIPFPPYTYSVDTNDTSVYGADHPVTTITFQSDPHRITTNWTDPQGGGGNIEDFDEIYVDLNGRVGSGSIALTNPADIIEDIAEEAGVASGDIEIDSGDRDYLDYLTFGFSILSPSGAMDIVADLAMQARSQIIWREGKLALQVLYNGTEGSVDGTISDYVEGQLAIREGSEGELVTRAIGRYRRNGTEQEIEVVDETLDDKYNNPEPLELDLWAHHRHSMTETIVEFWLTRNKYLREWINISTFLDFIEMERGDSIRVDNSDFKGSADDGLINSLDHNLTSNEIEMEVWFPDSNLTCNSSNETGCFTICETGTEVEDACETGCQTVIELTCGYSEEVWCFANETYGTWYPQPIEEPRGDQTSTEGGFGCGSCETSEESYCTSSCETDYEVSVSMNMGLDIEVTGCVASCETGCETGCEVSCETGCETDCETSSEIISADSCSDCSGDTPEYFDVVVEGVTECTGKNGTYRCYQMELDECTWDDESGNIQVYYTSGSDVLNVDMYDSEGSGNDIFWDKSSPSPNWCEYDGDVPLDAAYGVCDASGASCTVTSSLA